MAEGNDKSAPSIDELDAKRGRLENEVLEAGSALETAKATFAEAIKTNADDINALLELGKAVTAAEATVSTTQRSVSKCQTDIDGIRYDEAMSGVIVAVEAVGKDVRKPVGAWFETNAGIVSEYGIDTLTIVAKREESGAVTVSIKPTGEKMPKRPTSKRGAGTGERGTRGTRNVTTKDGTVMTCREYVAACGDQASPAAQADLAGTWDGSPISYTNEAKRLAAKNNDTFA